MHPIFIAGPCVIESWELLETVASRLVEINQRLGTEIIFKASFDKANRTSIHSFRGPGLEKRTANSGTGKEKVPPAHHYRHSRELSGRSRRTGVRHLANPCLPLSTNRPVGCSRQNGQGGEHQESPVFERKGHEISR